MKICTIPGCMRLLKAKGLCNTHYERQRKGNVPLYMRDHRHGQEKTRTYKSWRQMRQRCLNPNHHAYDRYGGRGITIDLRWDDYMVFLCDMGERPKGTSLDRIDPDRGYEPDNCRWSTSRAQANNRRNNIAVQIGRVRYKSVAAAARVHGVDRIVLYQRLKRGWSPRRAVGVQ